MNMTNSIIEFRRYLKRRNYSVHTIKNYLHSIKQFVVWVDMVASAICVQFMLSHCNALLLLSVCTQITTRV